MLVVLLFNKSELTMTLVTVRGRWTPPAIAMSRSSASCWNF